MTSVILDFEAQADWSLTFDPWTAVDIDGAATYGYVEGMISHMIIEPHGIYRFQPGHYHIRQ